jgi:hypothetical protein
MATSILKRLRNLAVPAGGPRWHYVEDGTVKGPCTPTEMAALYERGVIAAPTLVKQEGYSGGWLTCGDVFRAAERRDLSASSLTTNAPHVRPYLRHGVPDVTAALVYMHDGNLLVKARPVDLSATGIFVATPVALFAVGTKVKLTVKAPVLLTPFNAEATIVRRTDDPRYTAGYGLRFEKLPEEALAALSSLLALPPPPLDIDAAEREMAAYMRADA